MRFHMLLAGVLGVFGGMQMVAMGDVRMVGCFFVVVGFVVLGRLVVVARSVLVMLRCLLVMVGCFL